MKYLRENMDNPPPVPYHSFLICYVDDVVFLSVDEDQLLAHWLTVIFWFKKKQLFVAMSKVHIGCESIRFLGFCTGYNLQFADVGRSMPATPRRLPHITENRRSAQTHHRPHPPQRGATKHHPTPTRSTARHSSVPRHSGRVPTPFRLGTPLRAFGTFTASAMSMSRMSGMFLR